LRTIFLTSVAAQISAVHSKMLVHNKPLKIEINILDDYHPETNTIYDEEN